MSEPTYAFEITKDHLAKQNEPSYAVGTQGPRNATPELLARLKAGEGRRFKLLDGDRILYYEGRLVTSDDDMSDEACLAPLANFGTGYAGCATVEWPGHPEWDCG